MIAVQPTVEVVTAGTDWAAIIAAIVTGIAAILGIGGTAWQASRARKAATADLKTGIDAAVANQLRAEKMRVYSDFQGDLDNLLVVGAVSSAGEAVAAISRSAATVTLIAPGNICTIVRDLVREAGKVRTADFIDGPGPQDTISDSREELYELMRADLGTDQVQRGRVAS